MKSHYNNYTLLFGNLQDILKIFKNMVSAAKSNEPVRQGLVTMTGTFIDTIAVCTMTGLTIVISGCIEKNPPHKK